MITENIKYYEVEFKKVGEDYVLSKKIYFPNTIINNSELYNLQVELEQEYNCKLEMVLREVEMEYIHKTENELFTVYTFKEYVYCSQAETYRRLEDLFIHNSLKDGDFRRISYQVMEEGKLKETYVHSLEEFENKYVINKTIINENTFIINQFGQYENVQEETQRKLR